MSESFTFMVKLVRWSLFRKTGTRAPKERRTRTAQLVLEPLETRLVPASPMLLKAPSQSSLSAPLAYVRPTFQLASPAEGGQPAASPGPTGISPAIMRQGYGIDQVMFGSVTGDGTGQTIAIVDAYDQPNLVSDLNAFDAQNGLAAPPSFTEVNETGGSSLPAPDSPGGWGVEISLDVEWTHVIAPNASILLVEANSPDNYDLLTAVDTAQLPRRQRGVHELGQRRKLLRPGV